MVNDAAAISRPEAGDGGARIPDSRFFRRWVSPGRETSLPSPAPLASLPGRVKTRLVAALRPASRRLDGLPLYLLVFVVSLASSAVAGSLAGRAVPRVHDEFAYLLAGETFSHFRLTNPTPALPEFFETPHVLVEPSYMAKYPPGQGLALAIGCWLGDPIRGVWLSTAAFAAAVAWMLRGFFSPRWAFLGGLLAGVHFGGMHLWAQSFWGGSVAATGGALLFGGTRRLWRRGQPLDSALLGLGVVLLLYTRPFEGGLACLVPAAAFAARLTRADAAAKWRALLLPGLAIAAAGVAWLAYYNFRVTGSPVTLPYMLYEKHFTNAPLFLWQEPGPEPEFHNDPLRDFNRQYMVPTALAKFSTLGYGTDRMAHLLGNFLGVVGTVLAAAALAFAGRRWTLLATASAACAGSALLFCRWYAPHYQAPAAALYLFLMVAGFRALFLRLPRWVNSWPLVACAVVAAQIWLVALSPSNRLSDAARRQTTPRQRILDTLAASGGRHLLFVRLDAPYDPNVAWVYNEPLPEQSAVIWCWDRGPEENRRLQAAFPGRNAILMHLRGTTLSFTEITR